MSYDPNKPKSLDNLEQRLYSPRQDIVPKERRAMHEKQYNIPQDWERPVQEKEEPMFLDQQEKKANWFFRFFILAFLFFLGAAGYAGYIFMYGPQSIKRNVDILINAPLSTSGGEPFEFEVLVENRDASPIILSELVVEFPDGTRKTGDINTMYEEEKREIPVIEGGTISKQNFSALLFGEENEKKDIKVFLTYRTEDSNAFFDKEKVFDTVLRSTPVRMTVNHISETTSGQDVSFTIELVSNSTQDLKDIVVEGTFPFGFNLKKSTIPVQDDKKTWIIPSLRPKESITFTVTGSLDGLQGEEKFFKFVTGLKTTNEESSLVVFNTRNSTINIQRAFLELALNINGDSDQVINVTPGATNTGVISFKNNSTSSIRNAEIILSMSGSGLQKESVNVDNGFYNSNNNTITWDATTIPELANFPVGGLETLTFNFGTLAILSATNPELKFSIAVKGNRNTDGNVIDTLEDTIVRTIKFNSEVDFSGIAEYDSLVLKNTGPLPPRVGSKTSFNGVIEITNSSNRLQNAVLKMNVPNYIQYSNVFSPTTENVTYDPVSRTITWNIGTIEPKTGYQGNPAKKLYVQTSFVASISQLDQSPELLNNIMFEAVDSFTGEKVQRNIQKISSLRNVTR